MKKALQRIFHVFMAVVVLMSSTGFGLVEHSCTIRGKTTSLHKTGENCCYKKAFSNQKKSKNNSQLTKKSCCNEQEKYENVEYSSSVSQLVAKFVHNSVESIKNFVSLIVQTIIETLIETANSFFQNTSILSHSGRDICVFNQSFII